MRPLTGSDIVDFHTSGTEYLAMGDDGQVWHLDPDDLACDREEVVMSAEVTTEDGDDVTILLTAGDIADGEWFPDAIQDGVLVDEHAEGMAWIINNDVLLLPMVMGAKLLAQDWRKAVDQADRLALQRAQAVARVAAFTGNQSETARLLNLDPSTVAKLVGKARAAEQAATDGADDATS